MTRIVLAVGIALHILAILTFVAACAMPAVEVDHGAYASREHLLGYQTIVAGPLAMIGCAQPATLGLPWLANVFAFLGLSVTLGAAIARARAPIFLAAAGHVVAVLCTIPILVGVGDDARMCLDWCSPLVGYEIGAYVWVASIALLPPAALLTAFGSPTKSAAPIGPLP